jgi:3-phosphoshikimate 1-carboxyvinyltransferase
MKKIIDSQYKRLISVVAPASKSISIRAVAIAMAILKYNTNIDKFIINNFSTCDDAIIAINIVKKLGFIVENISHNSISLKYKLPNTPLDNVVLDCGNSALCYRLFSYFSKLFASNVVLSTSETLTKRIKNDNNLLINTLCAGEYEIDCSNTSQYLTGLLYSLPFLNGDSIIKINNLVSQGYIDMSIELLRKLGININYENDIIKITGNQNVNCNSLWIEGDWSAVSNFFVLGAISGDMQISNIDVESKQPDAVILELFKSLNIDVSQIANNIFFVNKSKYTGFEFDATNYPDLIPPLVVLAFNAQSPSKITSINRLINKESNRRDVLLKVFSMFGGKIRIVDDSFEIYPSKLTGGFADSHSDHRIAMAIAIAGKTSKNSITLTGAECVNKSFPDFWQYF